MEAITSISRRTLFKQAGGALIVSFALSGLKAQTPDKPLDPNEVDSFLAIHADGTVTIYTSKVDVGTGLSTAFRQVAAEELGIPIERFTVIEGDTSLTPDHGGTGGSSGIPRGAADIRKVAATARMALLDLAAKQSSGPFKRPDTPHRASRCGAAAQPESQSECPAEESRFLYGRRQTDTAERCSGKVYGTSSIPAGLHTSRHAARPRGASTGPWRKAAFGR
jgi:CO/xanthine dehydrogenase Mo-binding subunit